MNSLNDNRYIEDSGPFEARYLAFLETISTLRPSLHRYCARMTGSVMDGEDVVQETLFEAYRKLEKFDESRPVKPWLFRIAHNRCIDSCDAGECGTKPTRPSLCPKLYSLPSRFWEPGKLSNILC